jgi:hypothetical protein
MESNVAEFKFYGLDKRTNLYVNLSIGFLVVIIITMLSFIFWFTLKIISPRFSIVLAALIAFTIAILLLKPLGKKYRKEWKLTLSRQFFCIYFDNMLVSNSPVKNFTTVILRGDARKPKSNSRYLTLNDGGRKIKIIVTNSMYMPFSTLDDITCFDIFMKAFDEILVYSFVKKDMTKFLTPEGVVYFKYINNKNL